MNDIELAKAIVRTKAWSARKGFAAGIATGCGIGLIGVMAAVIYFRHEEDQAKN